MQQVELPEVKAVVTQYNCNKYGCSSCGKASIAAKVRENTQLPIAAYHVSGEYSMVMAAANNGWMDADKVFHECLTGIKRAGADIIISYAAARIAKAL